jgi:hypothetical protein
MEKCYRVCPKCGNTFAKFYVKENPLPDRPFYLVVFICTVEGCNHEWEEPIYEERILRKIKSSGYRQSYIDDDHVIKAEADRLMVDHKEKKALVEKWKWRGLSEWEIERNLRLRVKKLGGKLV